MNVRYSALTIEWTHTGKKYKERKAERIFSHEHVKKVDAKSHFPAWTEGELGVSETISDFRSSRPVDERKLYDDSQSSTGMSWESTERKDFCLKNFDSILNIISLLLRASLIFGSYCCRSFSFSQLIYYKKDFPRQCDFSSSWPLFFARRSNFHGIKKHRWKIWGKLNGTKKNFPPTIVNIFLLCCSSFTILVQKRELRESFSPFFLFYSDNNLPQWRENCQ